MIIIGTIIGSGFATGKEVAVYFSRFGAVSYFLIAITGALFFAIIYFFLSRGSHAFEKVSSSKFFFGAVCNYFAYFYFVNVCRNYQYFATKYLS